MISAVIDDRRSFTESPILSWIDMAESMYTALGGRAWWTLKLSLLNPQIPVILFLKRASFGGIKLEANYSAS